MLQIVSLVVGVVSTAGLFFVMTACSAWPRAQAQYLGIFLAVSILLCAGMYLYIARREERNHVYGAGAINEETQMQGIYVRGRFR